MKIASIKALWLHVPIPPAQQHRSDFGVVDSFDTTLVRVETADGVIGHGEGRASVSSCGNNAGVAALINDEFGPLLIGEDARDIRRLWELLYNGRRAHYALARGRSFPILGRRGIHIAAIGAIDMALWDIAGRALGVPVWRLLGGRCHDRLPAYASGGWAPAETIGEQLLGYIERGGFRAVKMRVGAGDGEVADSVRRVKAARKALGDGVDIMADAHGTYSVAEAKRFAREVAECRLAWFEEPVSADCKIGMAEVRATTDIPISAGESEFTRFDFQELAALRAVDIFQPDPAICGGITETMRIAALAETYQLKLAPHLWGGPLHFAAGVQIAAVSPAATILEYSLGANPLLHELPQERFTVADGEMVIPERPGLGVTINQDFVKRYAVQPH
jgi:L-alanine-DL-glutamate epimerase-like enolase superfamily enzyme